MMQVLGAISFDMNWFRPNIIHLIIQSHYFELSPSVLTWISSNVRFKDYKKDDPIAFLQQFEHIGSTLHILVFRQRLSNYY